LTTKGGRSLKQVVTVTLGVILTLAMATCGGDDDQNTTEQTQPSAGAETVAVSETDFAIAPANPRIDEAGSVEFEVTNNGKVVHALEIEGPSGESKTPDIQPGKSATLTANLDKPGSYVWYCPIGNHRELGMEGTIRVSGGAGQTGTTETDTTETSTTPTDTTTNTTETNTTETNTTETEPGEDSGGSGGSGGSGSGGSGSSGTGGSGTGGSGY
jgi:uncharacterized cupredoxin-like copper-binding protein